MLDSWLERASQPWRCGTPATRAPSQASAALARQQERGRRRRRRRRRWEESWLGHRLWAACAPTLSHWTQSHLPLRQRQRQQRGRISPGDASLWWGQPSLTVKASAALAAAAGPGMTRAASRCRAGCCCCSWPQPRSPLLAAAGQAAPPRLHQGCIWRSLQSSVGSCSCFQWQSHICQAACWRSALAALTSQAAAARAGLVTLAGCLRRSGGGWFRLSGGSGSSCCAA
jgi:hypothetical protein